MGWRVRPFVRGVDGLESQTFCKGVGWVGESDLLLGGWVGWRVRPFVRGVDGLESQTFCVGGLKESQTLCE